MGGNGTYTYPDGIKYVGQFKNGVFNGVFKNGKEVDGEYVFNDGLTYVKGSWDYATSKDRRFYTETLDTIKPAGEPQYTDKVPAPELPKDCYDVGNGYYAPKDSSIHDYLTKKKIRDASEKELQWAMKKCRVSVIGGGKSSSSSS